MRFGVREICEVVLRAKATQFLGNKKFYRNEPVLYFDSLKTSSLEGAATTVYATGGRGNTRLVAWEGERTLTFNMEDALISPESFAILSGAGLIDASEDHPIYVHTTSQVVLKNDNEIELPEAAVWNKCQPSDELYHTGADIFIMELKNGQIAEEPCIPASLDETHKIITCYGHHGVLKAGTVVVVDYYVKRTGGAKMIEITPDKFGGNYYLEASTLFRDEQSGVDMPAEFIIPNCKVQSNFTFTMAATGDPSTFNFVLDAFPDYTKFDQTHKVLAAIQVITEDVDTEEDYRQPCAPGQETGGDETSEDTFKLEVGSTADVTVNGHQHNDKANVVMTVSGTKVPTAYNEEMFGDLGTDVKAVDAYFTVPAETTRVKQINPSLALFSTDPSVKLEKDGQWVKDKTYTDSLGGEKFYVLITDENKNKPVKMEMYDKDGKLIKTYTIRSNVTFA